ncbi:hypothetical protein BHM03_00006614 [Ensete ventricosum]|nr:hypothetical protein BHM03_00006614 [Ensete ventricosum]
MITGDAAEPTCQTNPRLVPLDPQQLATSDVSGQTQQLTSKQYPLTPDSWRWATHQGRRNSRPANSAPDDMRLATCQVLRKGRSLAIRRRKGTKKVGKWEDTRRCSTVHLAVPPSHSVPLQREDGREDQRSLDHQPKQNIYTFACIFINLPLARDCGRGVTRAAEELVAKKANNVTISVTSRRDDASPLLPPPAIAYR